MGEVLSGGTALGWPLKTLRRPIPRVYTTIARKVYFVGNLDVIGHPMRELLARAEVYTLVVQA
jgi:hypothetical protein